MFALSLTANNMGPLVDILDIFKVEFHTVADTSMKKHESITNHRNESASFMKPEVNGESKVLNIT
jgi:hypothetical protein